MRRSCSLVIMVLCACKSDGPDESADSSSSSSTGATTTASTTTASTTSEPTTTMAPSTGSSESSGPATSTGVDSSSTTGAPGSCDFAMAVADTIADARNPVDCGQLTAADPLQAWQDARDCTRDAQLHQQAFSVSWQVVGEAATIDRAFASNGAAMPLYFLEDDSATDTTSITAVTCSGTGNPMDCMVAVGEICLECLEPTVAIELCE